MRGECVWWCVFGGVCLVVCVWWCVFGVCVWCVCLVVWWDKPVCCCSFPWRAAEEEDGTERVCDTLLMCIITVLNQGLRNGGGVGDVLRRPSKTVRPPPNSGPLTGLRVCSTVRWLLVDFINY